MGSFPCLDADEALDRIFKYTPSIPFWPQLPKRDAREGMIAQFSEHLPGLNIEEGKVSFKSSGDRGLELFYEKVISSDTDYFKISPDFAQGLYKFYRRLENSDLKKVEFIKGQITGPFTFASAITDDAGNPLLHDEVFLQAAVKGLGMKALWQLEFFAKFGKKMIIFIDEPYLSCVGSAYTPVNREEVVRLLSELAGQIKAKDCMVGVHCCGNTDWSMLTDTAGVDIISFDAFDFLERFVLYADNLQGFLKKGGIICWGIVPTQNFQGAVNPQMLIQKIKTGLDILENKGLGRSLLLERLLISPACGLGTLSAEKSEEVLKTLSETASLIAKNL